MILSVVREKMKRSKSVFQKRSLLNESENNKDEKSDNDFQNLSKKVFVNALKSNIFNSSSFIKSNPLPSDILEEEMKFSFYGKYPKKNNDYKELLGQNGQYGVFKKSKRVKREKRINHGKTC